MTALYDNHGRPLNYLRLAVTDRCNLRCFYCMPEEGVRYLPRRELLTFEEILRLVAVMTSMGVTKVRLTGGEPFARNDLMQLIRRLVAIPGLRDLHLTTNGILTTPHVPELKRLGIASVNLSLDSLNPETFFRITRRDAFRQAMDTLDALRAHEIPVKVNAVVMDGKNIADIVPLATLARDSDITVRFIEEMPFNGEGTHDLSRLWTQKKILSHLQAHFPAIYKVDDPEHSTAYHYHIPGFRGKIGIIAAFTRSFCGSCNRIRMTAQGMLKTCLYDNGVLNIKEAMRSGADDANIAEQLMYAFNRRPKDGFEAEANRADHRAVFESMSTIGG